jgi:hypothetical protein
MQGIHFIAVALTENGSTTLPLITDHTTHGDFLYVETFALVFKERPPATVGGSLSISRTSNRKWACRVGVENSSEDGLCGL